jgi:N-acetylgalactosamine-6-sulfatase
LDITLKYLVLFAICLASSGLVPARAAGRPPNIVLILGDDMGWGDAHCYGHPYARTPSIDKLASEGTRFTQCYSTGVTCCPSRTGFMTSKLPATFSADPASAGFGSRVTITELLKMRGYVTGHFGKWHIGPTTDPGTYGIDVIVSAGTEVARKRREQRETRGRDAYMYDEALAFIEANKDRPFYVNIWDHIPHSPINPSQTLLDNLGPMNVDEAAFPPAMQAKFASCKALGGDVSTSMRAYLAELNAMDAEIGKLMNRLDTLGLRDNTIVVFSSDQGPAPIVAPATGNSQSATSTPANDKGKSARVRPLALALNMMGSAGPFRGGKHNQYEGGLRIPFIVRWPGHVRADRVDDASVISGVDWLPTLCSLTGTDIDPSQFDGEDASPAWWGSEFSRRTPLMWKTSSPPSASAIRDGHWKLHHPNSRRGDLELYDLAIDPAEQKNVASENPEIVKELSSKLMTWQTTLPKTYSKSETADTD